jgi:hypothetical protein
MVDHDIGMGFFDCRVGLYMYEHVRNDSAVAPPRQLFGQWRRACI